MITAGHVLDGNFDEAAGASVSYLFRYPERGKGHALILAVLTERMALAR